MPSPFKASSYDYDPIFSLWSLSAYHYKFGVNTELINLMRKNYTK